MFEAVIFDWDGTLADTHNYVVDSFQKVLRKAGCKVSDMFIQRRIGKGAKTTFEDALKAAALPFTSNLIDVLVEKKVETQMEHIGNITLFEGAIDLLCALHNKVQLGLASMNNKSVINNLLHEKQISGFFMAVIAAEDVFQPKPNPEIFLKCAAKLKVYPEKCVVLEDSVFGVQASRKAKMKCIAVPTGAYSIKELRKQKPNLIVNSITEKEKILGFILG